MPNIAIKVQSLSKRYLISEVQKPDTVRDQLVAWSSLPKKILSGQWGEKKEEFWALKDVSFEVKQGEVLGIIGKNGSGKSTLLKILARITEPTSGKATMHGRVASLLEVGTGFVPELSGRENVFLNGAILGMSRKEIRKKFDEIVDFSGVEQFIDTPVKRYSSGMYVRLAFAVAAHLDSDILLVDEVLAVGDAEFQKKCLLKMQDIIKSSRTILFISHNLEAIQNICMRTMWLSQGSVIEVGETESVVMHYLTSQNQSSGANLSERTDREGNGNIIIFDVKMYTTKSNDVIRSGDDLVVEFSYSCKNPTNLQKVIFSFPFINSNGIKFVDFNSKITQADFGKLNQKGRIRCIIPRLALKPGSYSINTYASANGDLCDWVLNAKTFEVHPGKFYLTGKSPDVGFVLMDHRWEVVS